MTNETPDEMFDTSSEQSFTTKTSPQTTPESVKNQVLHFLGNISLKQYIIGGIILFSIMPIKNTLESIIKKSVVIVHPGQQGLITSFGKLQDNSLTEGIHFIQPFVTNVALFDMRIQRTDLESTARTKDLQRIKTNTTLNWQIEPEKVTEIYQKIGSKDDIVNKIITPSLDETLKASIPARTLDQLFGQREQLKTEVSFKMKNRLAPYGIIVNDVNLVNLTASDEFTKATEQRQIAEQQAITARIVAEQQIKEAELKALQAKKEADTAVYKAEGESKAQKLLQQTLTPALLQKQAIEKWDGKYPIVTGGSSLPLINLNIPPAPAPETKP